MRSPQKTLAMWAIIGVVAVLMFQMYETGQQSKVRDFKYPEFIKALNANQISKVTRDINVLIAGINHGCRTVLNRKGASSFSTNCQVAAYDI